MGSNNQDVKRQLIILSIVLVIVIVLAIILNVNINSNDEEENVNTENTTIETDTGDVLDMNDVVVDGYTIYNIENAKSLMEEDTYEEYKELFEKIENGEITYEEGMSLQTDEEEVDEDLISSTDEQVQEAQDNGDYSYYVTEDGTVTNIVIYDNLDFHSEEE